MIQLEMENIYNAAAVFFNENNNYREHLCTGNIAVVLTVCTQVTKTFRRAVIGAS